ncbi:hypothetical protein Airi01_095210 [Actinoallomurus iriomotensis]|uniref:Transposase putative helix-turn-helix domain-containing protein n=1 Tax=Actinoallomurus iriomotensis TaxID=478107 RepID=A0A9W6RTF6_9ACTN|nr:hypothetical protein Airi01_095210 [Actinoallomurus iriomotensis]
MTIPYRLYPTDAQAAELSRTFGCVRKVYNLALEARTDAWKSRRERVGYNAASAMLTAWGHRLVPAPPAGRQAFNGDGVSVVA